MRRLLSKDLEHYADAASSVLIKYVYSIGVLKVSNIREDILGPNEHVKVCWKRNNRVSETPESRVVHRMACFDHALQLFADLEYEP